MANMLHRSFKYKLYPNAQQESVFWQFAGVVRLVYNLALEQRRDWYQQFARQTGTSLNFYAQSVELTKLRREYNWISAVSQTCQSWALKDLEQSFTRFFKGLSGYPKPRKRGVNDAFRFHGREVQVRAVNTKWSLVKLPKLGWVKFRNTRALQGKILNATVKHSSEGWTISFACESENSVVETNLLSVGIDRGITNTLSLSTGEHLSVPETLKALERRQRKAQRVLSRRKRGSARHKKAKKRVAAIYAKAARIRNDWHHKASTDIARRFGTVVVEDLKIANMSASAKGTVGAPGRCVKQKSGLNRAILNQGWFRFTELLEYKLEERGGHLFSVNPAYTSQTCSACEAVDARNRKNQAAFECVECGYCDNADTNAAINILRRWNTPLLPVEALIEGPLKREPQACLETIS